MRLTTAEKLVLLPEPVGPKKICECGQPIYDGRKNKCSACKAAIKKSSQKRKYTKHNYAKQEQLLAALKELENAVQMQEWMLAETKKRIIDIKAVMFEI